MKMVFAWSVRPYQSRIMIAVAFQLSIYDPIWILQHPSSSAISTFQKKIEAVQPDELRIGLGESQTPELSLVYPPS